MSNFLNSILSLTRIYLFESMWKNGNANKDLFLFDVGGSLSFNKWVSLNKSIYLS